jgi:solute carrier family 25 (mitochondrial thiamine pyrophosphate transporter), member 19
MISFCPLLCGAVAGAASRLTTSPIDLLKIRLQVQRFDPERKYRTLLQSIKTIYHEEGLRGFWKGTTPALVLYITYTACQFEVYDLLNGLFNKDTFKGASFLKGAISAGTGTLITYPFDLVRTKMSMHVQRIHIPSVITGIIKEEGIKGLYKGLAPTLGQIMLGMACTFWIHDALTRKDCIFEGKSIVSSSLIAGAISGIAAKTLTMPIDVLRKRLQLNACISNASILSKHSMAPVYVNKPASIVSSSIIKELGHIWRVEGIRGLWSGWTMAICKAAPVTAVTFGVYGTCMRAMNGG